MNNAGGREKLAILGGGLGALSTAFELTSAPDWRDRFESITIYQLGWRLGGKCASSRGPWNRIEEHGIHGFLGSYYNALPMMAACYRELERKPDQPLATFDEAFRRQGFGVSWERVGRTFAPWPQDFPENTHSPEEPLPTNSGLELGLRGVAEAILGQAVLAWFPAPIRRWAQPGMEHLAGRIGAYLAEPRDHPGVAAGYAVWKVLRVLLFGFLGWIRPLRRNLTVMDHILTTVSGALADDVQRKGYDHLDDENFSDWLRRHGAREATIKSPFDLIFINMTYQYPGGDTSLPPRMAAGAYVHWALQASGYLGQFIWLFAAGTGETLIAPLYEVLRRRGVKFEFFHKVEALRLSADRTRVAGIEMAVQATLKRPERGYHPLIKVKGLRSWPVEPRYSQLVEGPQLRAHHGLDLESYWTDWKPVARRTLAVGRDFDRVVFAISIGAVPHLCDELLEASPAWQGMVDNVPALMTQAMQVWMTKSSGELGFNMPHAPTDSIISATYLNPHSGHAELSDLIPYEDWPSAATPRGLWYFCGLMTEEGKQPPFSDHAYPARMHARVKHQCIQYLQAGIGTLLPGASVDESNPPGDPFGFDFNLLVDTRPQPAVGVARFDEQFWRANIDPTERYVASPPGSTKHRIKAWNTGFANLVIAGDWAYTGLNVGSVEGTVISGRLACHALTGAPRLEDIPGYR